MITYPNNWIPRKDLEEMSNSIYDFLVFHSNALNIPTMNGNLMFSQLLPDNSTPVGKYLPQLPGAREVYALGGRTLFWNGASPRPIDSKLRRWPIHPKELDFYFSLAEREMIVNKFYSRGASIQNILMSRLYNNRYLKATVLPLAIDMQESILGRIHSNPWFSSINMLSRANFHRPFDLALNAFASRIIIENNIAKGVEVFSTDKKPYVIPAKNIVISASALEAPRILLDSGLSGYGIGRYLTNHMFISGRSSIPRNQFNEELGNLSILLPESSDTPYQIQLTGSNPYYSYQQFQEKQFTEELIITSTAFGAIESRAENRVTLNSNVLDEYGIPTIDVDYSLTNNDLALSERMKDGISLSTSALGATPTYDSLNLQPYGSDYHESCTCRMGLDPDTSVVDHNAKVHGVTGLYASGNSILPSLAAANPTLSSVALAIRLADHLVIKDIPS